MHDAVACGHHVDIVERAPGPFDEVETVLVAPVLDRAVLGKGVRIEAAVLHGQAVVDDQLGRHDGIDLGGVAALIRDRVAQARQIDQRRLPKDIVADDARRIPREVQIAPAIGDLDQCVAQQRGVAAAHQLLGQYARHIGQRVIGAGADRLDRGPRIEKGERRTVERLLIGGVHRVAGFHWASRVAIDALGRVKVEKVKRPAATMQSHPAASHPLAKTTTTRSSSLRLTHDASNTISASSARSSMWWQRERETLAPNISRARAVAAATTRWRRSTPCG